MFSFKKIEEFAKNLNESIPKVIQDFTHNLDNKIHEILNNQINRMNFITRKEFTLQSQILVQIQEEIKKIKNRLEVLEKKYKIHKHQNNLNNKN